jgi:hypothetical protein
LRFISSQISSLTLFYLALSTPENHDRNCNLLDFFFARTLMIWHRGGGSVQHGMVTVKEFIMIFDCRIKIFFILLNVCRRLCIYHPHSHKHKHISFLIYLSIYPATQSYKFFMIFMHTYSPPDVCARVRESEENIGKITPSRHYNCMDSAVIDNTGTHHIIMLTMRSSGSYFYVPVPDLSRASAKRAEMRKIPWLI